MELVLLVGWILLPFASSAHGHNNSSSGISEFCIDNALPSDVRHCPVYDENLLWFILSLFLIIAWGAFVRTMLRVTKLNVPYTVILMITGLIIGSGTHFRASGVCEFWSMFTKIARVPPKIILYTFLPVLIFESAYSMDVHVFMRSLSQILVIALPGMILSVLLTGFFCYGFMTTYQWNYPTSFMYGSIISATDPVAVVAILKELGTSKRLSTLIEGESLMNDGVAVLMFEIFKMMVEGDKDKHILLKIIFTLLKIGIGGPAFGLLTGKICSISLGMIFNDAATEITIMLFSSYLVYWAAEEMGISGVISVAVMALKMSEQETSISPEVKKNVHHFWGMVGYLANTVLFVLVGIILSETAIGQIDSLDWFNLFFLYANLSMQRLATLMILMPWLTRIGYGLKWQDMMVSVWGGLRGAVGLCLALDVFYSTELCLIGQDQIGPKFLFHTGGIVFLTLFINGTTTKTVLDALHLTDVSPGRLQDMKNAIKQIIATKERAILQYRHKPSLTDASWKSVARYTRMVDPYKKQRDKIRLSKGKHLSDKTSLTLDSENGSLVTVDGTSLGSGSMIYTFRSAEVEQVLHSTSESEAELNPDETTIEIDEGAKIRRQHARELLEAEECQQRVIKALKVSFWRQYGKGVLSDVAVQILISSADRAGDKELTIITAASLKRYYELHGFFHWFQTHIAERFNLDAHRPLPKKPKKEWRHPLWWLATREWFGDIITGIVLLSLIPAIWEFELEVGGFPQTREERIGFLFTNLVFNFIYFLEFLIKIMGLGVKGYFKDRWNWLDLFVLLLGVTNVTTNLAYFSADESRSASAGLSLFSRIRIFRFFRIAKIIRTIRLLKCCAVRAQGFMNNRINHSIFLGYDIGMGFVKAVDDVIKFLPQMVENERVLRQLELALQIERLETIRLLGLLQQKHPTIAIAVKTRHASRAVLNEMRGTVYILRDEGLLDHTEYLILNARIESEMKGLWSTPVAVIPNAPGVMLKTILWLHAQENAELAELVQTNAALVNFADGELICNVGDEPNGIYLIVSGMVKVHFLPTTEIIEAQQSTGELPNVEVLGNMSFGFEGTDYLQVGYLLGEIGVLTGLPSTCTVSCATPVTLYHIPQETMKLAIKNSEAKEDSLESRIWRAVGMRIAAALLRAESEYQSWTVDRIQFHVEHSAVPIGLKFENMTIPDYIMDVVLLQGQIQDGNSKEIFIAPRLLPRSCKKLSMVPDSAVPTRFLVIAEDELEGIESDEEDDKEGNARNGMEGEATEDPSFHHLVKRASRVERSPPFLHEIAGKSGARQLKLLRKIQFAWN